MSGDLSGKTVLITGGNVGLGRAVALELARKKAEVVIAGRSKDSCETTVKDITALTKNDKVYRNLILIFSRFAYHAISLAALFG